MLKTISSCCWLRPAECLSLFGSKNEQMKGTMLGMIIMTYVDKVLHARHIATKYQYAYHRINESVLPHYHFMQNLNTEKSNIHSWKKINIIEEW